MDYSKYVNRSVHLTQIQHLLHKNPGGLTSRKLAELCGIGTHTVQRDMLTLQNDLGIPITRKSNDRYGIDVEVIAPSSLRQQFAQYARKSWEIYGRLRDGAWPKRRTP